MLVADVDTSMETVRSESPAEGITLELNDSKEIGNNALISCGDNSDDSHPDGSKAQKKLNDIDLSGVGEGSFHSSSLRTEDSVPSERLYNHQCVGIYRRSSSFDHLGISKMRDWLKERLGDHQPEPHVLTDAYIQESMAAFKDGR